MVMAVERTGADRIRAWLLAAPVSQRKRETGFARSTLHDWLAGKHMPRGGVLIVVLGYVATWEREVADASAKRKAPVRPVEAPRPWAQGIRRSSSDA